LASLAELHETVKNDLDESCRKNDELESELEQTREDLSSALIRGDAAVASAIAKTKAESEAEIQRLKGAVAKVAEIKEKVKAMKTQYRDFKKEARGLPRWYKKLFANYSKPIFDAIEHSSQEQNEFERRYHVEMAARKELHNQLITLKGNIRVFCRSRPVLDAASITSQVVHFDALDNGVVSLNHKGNTNSFSFDRAFGPTTTQEEVFAEVCPLVTSVVDGYNLCIFAYGQTGSGKTYTMEGPMESPGINRRALARLFEIQSERALAGWNYENAVSILEIYNENVYDLLSSTPHNKLDTKGTHYNAVSSLASNVEEIDRVLRHGSQNRAVAETKLNSQSSRSHAIVRVCIRGHNERTLQKTEAWLNLCDLAGSENVSASNVVGARLEEAKNINKSLSALGLVINSLQSKQAHIPYRNSKLTTLLEQSLTGESKVLMVVQVAPEESHVASTKESLKFGERASKVEIGRRVNLGGTPRSRTPQRTHTPQRALTPSGGAIPKWRN